MAKFRIDLAELAYIIELIGAVTSTRRSILQWMLSIGPILNLIDTGCDARFLSTRIIWSSSDDLRHGCLIEPLANEDAAAPTGTMIEMARTSRQSATTPPLQRPPLAAGIRRGLI